MKTSCLEHKTLDLKTYEDLYNQCPQSNILQSAAYGEAKCRVERFRVERRAIMESDRPIALYQVLIKPLFPLGIVARINRGPLYLQNKNSSPNNPTQIYRSLYEEWIVKKNLPANRA